MSVPASPPVRLVRARRVLTLDLARPVADAFLMRGDRIVAVGEAGTLSAAASPGTRPLDLRDLDVFPGFHDAHTHLSGGALERAGLDLRRARSSEEVLGAVRAAAVHASPGAWIRGFGWDDAGWEPAGRPTREALDRAAGSRPVFLGRSDGHAVWCNTAALERVAPGSEPRGGVLREDEATRARSRVPLPAGFELESLVTGALAEAARWGLTSLEDVVEPWSLGIYRRLLERGAWTVRVGAWLPVDADDREADEWRRLHPPDDPRLSCGVRKVFLDGSLGSRTAALEEPYADEPGCSGEIRGDPTILRRRLRSLAEDGWAVALHAVGDRAVRLALDLLHRLPRPEGGRRHRIEHAQVVSLRDLVRVAASDAVVSLQPAQWIDDRFRLASRLGRGRPVWVHPWRRLVAAGAAVAFGSDWPVAPLDPRAALAAAVRGGRSREEARRAPVEPAGREGELLEWPAALAAYTAGPARAVGDERRGSIREGSRADFVAVAPTGPGGTEDPDGWTVAATFVGGRRVWPEGDSAEV